MYANKVAHNLHVWQQLERTGSSDGVLVDLEGFVVAACSGSCLAATGRDWEQNCQSFQSFQASQASDKMLMLLFL